MGPDRPAEVPAEVPVEPRPGRSGGGEDVGGDPVCWLHRVCPACGRLADADPPTTCPACGEPIEE